MKRKRLLWQIFPPMLIVTVVAVFGTTFYASKLLRHFYLEETQKDLRIRTQLVLEQLEEAFLSGSEDQLARRCREIARKVEARITLVLANGEVVADSVEDPVRMDNHADREEIAAALEGRYGTTIRFSRTLGKNMLYVAVPVFTNADADATSGQGYIFGVVRLSIPLFSIESVLNRIYWEHLFGAFVLLAFAALITLFVSRKISRPLEEMGLIAKKYGELDLKKKIHFPQNASISREVAGLAETINKMAEELHTRIEKVTEQKNELEAVLQSMVEGVIVVDPAERVVRANKTALNLFRLKEAEVNGRAISEVFRDADLLGFVRKTLAGGAYNEQDLVFHQIDGGRHFHASGTPLHDSLNRRTGALVVLNDITRTKKLENMRREFVANVSHELKTPITSVKGFVETLLDGALDEKEDARRFLNIIHKQANRLNAIVDDLLSLSRIEQEEEHGSIELQVQPLRPALENCLESCVMKARDKDIELILDCDPQISVAMNQNLLEQAVTNLLVNAIKYSQENGDVHLSALCLADEVCIKVIDQGCGIASEHLPRLFERFYRSDKARSRKLGGTGLGLAIVKHIIQAHEGRVEVHSIPGKGSTFSIFLPGS